MFYIKQPGNKIPYHNIPPGKKRGSVDWVSPVFSITKKYPTLCILFICPCCASYLGCDSTINSEAPCHSTSGGIHKMSVLFCWCTVILGISRKEMSLCSRGSFRISQHCANRLIKGRGKWVLFPLSQVEVELMSRWVSCFGPQQRAWTTIGELLFSCLLLSPGPPIYSFLSMPGRWKKQELKPTERVLMEGTKQLMLANAYWVPAVWWLLWNRIEHTASTLQHFYGLLQELLPSHFQPGCRALPSPGCLWDSWICQCEEEQLWHPHLPAVVMVTRLSHPHVTAPLLWPTTCLPPAWTSAFSHSQSLPATGPAIVPVVQSHWAWKSTNSPSTM